MSSHLVVPVAFFIALNLFFKKVKIKGRVKAARGLGVFPGVVSGRVLIVRKLSDFKKGAINFIFPF